MLRSKGLHKLKLDGLSVSYRATETPQRLDIVVTSEGRPALANGALFIKWIINALKIGAGTGSEFDPLLGTAEWLSGPLSAKDPGAKAADVAWSLNVCALSPLFIGTFVASLASAGTPYMVRSLHIHGSVPMDASPLSVTEAKVSAWLEDRDAYPGHWEQIAYPFELLPKSNKGCSIRIAMATDVTDESAKAIEDLLNLWGCVINLYTSPDGSGTGLGDPAPTLARAKQEITARYQRFNYRAPAVFNPLLNMLDRFHRTQVPLRAVEIYGL